MWTARPLGLCPGPGQRPLLLSSAAAGGMRGGGASGAQTGQVKVMSSGWVSWYRWSLQTDRWRTVMCALKPRCGDAAASSGGRQDSRGEETSHNQQHCCLGDEDV